jgi:hypothetical protein
MPVGMGMPVRLRAVPQIRDDLERVVSAWRSRARLRTRTSALRAGLVSSVTWEKPESEVLPSDTNYYTLALRLRVPNQPFTTLYFPAYQTCQTADGELIEVAWSAAVSEDEVPEGEEPAPSLTILPARVTGWNQLTVPVAVEDLSVFFADAQIVWKGDAAYSSNAAATELIGSTDGVTELTSLEEGDEIWVKY